VSNPGFITDSGAFPSPQSVDGPFTQEEDRWRENAYPRATRCDNLPHQKEDSRPGPVANQRPVQAIRHRLTKVAAPHLNRAVPPSEAASPNPFSDTSGETRTMIDIAFPSNSLEGAAYERPPVPAGPASMKEQP
jgi:hypothetical protein